MTVQTSRSPQPPVVSPRSVTKATPVETVWLDVARIAAITAVVVLHAVAVVVTRRYYSDIGTATWWTANVVDSLMRWCVPVFIMISGALLLAPRREGLRSFYQRRFNRIGIPLVVWSVVYLSIDLFVKQASDWSDALNRVLAGKPSVHLYFLFVLAGLYALTPFLRVLTAHAPRRMLWWAAVFLTAVGVADQAISDFAGIGEANAVTRFLPFLGYYLLGYLLRDCELGKRGMWVAEWCSSRLLLFFHRHCRATAVAYGVVHAGRLRLRLSFPDCPVCRWRCSCCSNRLLDGGGGSHRPDRDDGGPPSAAPLADLSFRVFLIHLVLLQGAAVPHRDSRAPVGMVGDHYRPGRCRAGGQFCPHHRAPQDRAARYRVGL